jgi:hypothetical protein
MSNGWAEAKYAKEGSYTSYLIDLHEAWRLAESTDHWSIAQQIRCALIDSSIHTLSENISPHLLLLFVEQGLWRPERVVEYQYLRQNDLTK